MTDLRNDDDLEQLLRSTLSARGETITSGPTWQGSDVGDEVRPAPPRSRWIAPVAAAAAAAVVAAFIVVARQPHGDKTPPSTPSPSVTGSLSTTPTGDPTPPSPSTRSTPDPATNPQPVRLIDPKRCANRPLQAWTTAFHQRISGLNALTGAFPLAAQADGALLISRHAVNGRTDVALRTATGLRSLLTVPAADEMPFRAWFHGDTVAVPLYRKTAADTTTRLDRLDLIDLGTGAVTVVPPLSASAQRTAVLSIGSTLYWDERTSATGGSIIAYDLTSRTTPVV